MRYDIINSIISRYGFTSYLEIGLDDPNNNFNKIICECKESVDPYFSDTMDHVKIPPAELTYHMTSDDLFMNMEADKKYDIVFIDGLHEQVQVYKDFINAYNHLNVGGFIIMHDCKPTHESLAQFPRNASGAWYGTSWKAIPTLKDFNDIDCYVIDTDCGCGIYRKTKDDTLEIKSIDKDYDFFRYPFLVDLISEEDFKSEYLQSIKVDVYVLCYNEMKLAPLMMQYWKLYANHVYICDNGSTDGCLEYFAQFPEFITVYHFDFDGMDDEIHMYIKNNIWKQSRNKGIDFVMVCDFDECLFCNNIIEKLNYLKENDYTIIKPVGLGLICEEFPIYNKNILAHNSIKTCNYDFYFNKMILFNPDKIQEINYGVGAHKACPSGKVKLYDTPNIFLLHFDQLGLNYVFEKRENRKNRLSEKNKEHGWGMHYLYSKEQIEEEFRKNLETSQQITDIIH